MRNHPFVSKLGKHMADFVESKRACGRRYDTEFRRLQELDRLLEAEGLSSEQLPQRLVEKWIAKRKGERPNTQRIRISLVRQFTTYLHSCGIPAYILNKHTTPIIRNDYCPYIYTRAEIHAMVSAADSLQPCREQARYHIIMPVLIRLLYCCGLRIGEALKLTRGDYLKKEALLLVRNGKFGVSRQIPLSGTIQKRIEFHLDTGCSSGKEASLFESRYGRPFHQVHIRELNRQLMKTAGVQYGGKSKGPRIHDYRHTFAVHRLEQWLREDVDLNAMLPYLATYMGHASLRGTQYYLRLTAAIFPELSHKMEDAVGRFIRRAINEKK